MTEETSRVPQPPIRPIVGNLGEIEPGATIQSMVRLAGEYGEFYKLKLLNRETYVVSSQRLVDELCDETRFEKSITASLARIRAFAGDGLFTAYNDEPNWGKAHRLLMPAFGPIAIRGMFDQMVDIADQMLLRWERFGPDAVIDVTDDMTRLTLDTIALCAFGTRFNSFYQDDLHPFVGAMVRGLEETGRRNRRPEFVNRLPTAGGRRHEADMALMRAVASELIRTRREDPDRAVKRDLLGTMLDGVDPLTKEPLSDENIGYQLVTFLIAGHETTSGLLSFATWLLLANPDVLQRARTVVDDVAGTEPIRIEHMPKLRYLEQVLMEALRLWPTAPAFAVRAREPTVIGGRHALTPEDRVIVMLPALHRDPAVWGEDAEAFRPERFAPELAERLPPNAWKPFGNGARACIGRPFAMQEAQLVLAKMLQRFDLTLDDPGYQLAIHETLTIKPEGLRIRAKARHEGGLLTRRDGVASAPQPGISRSAQASRKIDAAAPPLSVLYGSNAGSSQAFAERIADDAADRGFRADAAALDDAAGRLPDERALVIVTASYEGQPPDNAGRFVSWIESIEPGSLTGRRYALFGCGNRQWARTYQAIPRRIEAALDRAGAVAVLPRGEADSGGDFFGAFDEWCGALWPALAEACGTRAPEPSGLDPLQVEIADGGRERALRIEGHAQAVVVENRELVDMTAAGARSKRHIELALPEGQTYRAGDYLVVLARNPAALVDRALRRLGLTAATELIVHRPGSSVSTLPLGRPVAAADLLANYVELAQPATRGQLRAIAAAAACPPERAALERLAGPAYEDEALARRMSVLDLLERHPSVDLPLASFLSMMPPMRPRQYSISSSPLWRPDHATLTVAVVDAPALSGEARFQGIASTYLAGAQPGDRVSVAVRPSNTRFHPPADPATPIVLICAGSGIAPFRGFLQERAAQKGAGRAVGPALLFFGVDAPEVDFLYRDELSRWEAAGVVEVLPAFSATPVDGVVFVQDRVWQERQRVSRAFSEGAVVYVCGDGKRMAPAVRGALVRIYRAETGADEAAAAAWADEVEHDRGRYVSDVFA